MRQSAYILMPHTDRHRRPDEAADLNDRHNNEHKKTTTTLSRPHQQATINPSQPRAARYYLQYDNSSRGEPRLRVISLIRFKFPSNQSLDPFVGEPST